ncbi:MAG: hypothetical protein OEU93_11290 [Rubrivivax sp.]|jgi:hypothetical protein|nr:hypothetical protein [Rubrivivax sp.]MDH4290637.1 hypothetical protein [Aquincola sp.]MDH5331066.1 hypothetical protein [Aquincola sp.]
MTTLDASVDHTVDFFPARALVRRIVDSVATGRKYHLKVVFGDGSEHHTKAIGANAGRDNGGGQRVVTQDVQRYTSTPDAAHPDYWDVSYHFRGQDYRMQMSTPPGAFVTVNRRGEPRA